MKACEIRRGDRLSDDTEVLEVTHLASKTGGCVGDCVIYALVRYPRGQRGRRQWLEDDEVQVTRIEQGNTWIEDSRGRECWMKTERHFFRPQWFLGLCRVPGMCTDCPHPYEHPVHWKYAIAA